MFIFDVLIIESEMAVGLLMDALTGIMRDIMGGIDVDLMMVMNVNVFADVTPVFEFVIPRPLEVFNNS